MKQTIIRYFFIILLFFFGKSFLKWKSLKVYNFLKGKFRINHKEYIDHHPYFKDRVGEAFDNGKNTSILI
jgi:hypothetical protein